MEEWRDAGLVVAARRHGESSLVVSLFTASHGRYRGLTRSGGKRGGAVCQPGNVVMATWRARLSEHLGSLSCELLEAGAARVIDDPLRLAAVAALCATVEAMLPEREALPALYAATLDVLARLQEGDTWPAAYVRWELRLLADLGYGLDLASCAVTGATDDLAYVSPKSGRAVSSAAAGVWRDRLLPLPGFLRDDAALATAADIRAGFALTGHFIEARLVSGGIPARQRLIERLPT